MPGNRLAVDAAHLAGVMEVHPVNHADGFGGDQVAADHAQAAAGLLGAEPGLDSDAQTADGVDHATQGIQVSHPQIVVIA